MPINKFFSSLLAMRAPILPDSGEAKVANFEVAVGVDEDVGGLEVTVQHIRGVNVLQASQYLKG